jgi:copper resistance protein B
MPAEEKPAADPHAGHQMAPAMQPPKAPPPPEALSGPEHAADNVYDPARMAASREELRREHGDLTAYRFFLERAETRIRDGRDGYLVDAQAWYGGDINKFWVKGEVEGAWGEKVEHAEIQALWSHAIDPWFDLQTGIRYDPQPGSDRAHLVLGVQGLAPYWWEIDAALFLSNKGEVTARAEAEYDLRITQKLILQPRGEFDFSLQNIRELGIGAGLSQAAIGLRLRYQVSQLVAPYVGVEYERALGNSADFRRAEGEDADSWNLLAGIRMWF